MDGLPAMLTPAQVAHVLGVHPKTVTRWAREGRLAPVMTPGGHRQYPTDGVLVFLCGTGFAEEAARTAVMNAVH